VEVAVRVRLAGICATDLEIARGYMGFEGVLGHEFVGEALEGPLAGRRVVGEINAACGACADCQAGLGRHCAGRTVLGIVGRDGAFAETLTLPSENLLTVPDGVPDEAAVFAEPLAAAFEILEQVKIPAGARVGVLGDGRLGLLCAFALASAGGRVTLLGRHAEKLALAEKRGIDTLRSEADGLPAELRRCQDVVVEATGSATGLFTALDWVRPRGTLVLKTTTHDVPPASLARIVIDEITVVGSRCGRFAPALDALASGRVDPSDLVEAVYPLSQGERAFEHAGRRGVRKILLRVEEGA
jgi:threonine dehydrogenase-like Zn-dependent dehydrogenase